MKTLKQFIDEGTFKLKKAKKIKKHGKKRLGQNPGDGGLAEDFINALNEVRLKFHYEDEEELENLEDTSSDDKPSDKEKLGKTNDEDEPKDSDMEGQEVKKDPDRQGLIRKIKGAHLVYKRQSGEGTYDELWVYMLGNGDTNELEIKKDILAGTDIDPNTTKSEDGIQSYQLWTAGNAQMMKIVGLQN